MTRHVHNLLLRTRVPWKRLGCGPGNKVLHFMTFQGITSPSWPWDSLKRVFCRWQQGATKLLSGVYFDGSWWRGHRHTTPGVVFEGFSSICAFGAQGPYVILVFCNCPRRRLQNAAKNDVHWSTAGTFSQLTYCNLDSAHLQYMELEWIIWLYMTLYTVIWYDKSHGFLNFVISLFVASLRPVSGWGLGSDNRLSFASGNAACGVPSTGLQASKVCSLYQFLQPVEKHWSLPYPRFCKAASVQLQLEY